jgi:S1-C subfamily serine protease
MIHSPNIADVVEKAQLSILQVQGAHGRESALCFTDDIILTTAHSITEKTKISTLDGEEIEAELLGVDPRLDLAVLQVKSTQLQPLPIAASPRVGDVILTIGSDPTTGPRISSGVVSSLGGSWFTPKGAKVDHRINVDATLPWGSSGGALLTTNGELIGLNTHAIIRGGTTLSVETLTKAIERIQQTGSVVPGWLGVHVHETEIPKSLQKELAQEKGLLLLRVWAAAKRGGLQVGDILVGIDDNRIDDFNNFKAEMSGAGGKEMRIKIIRAGEINEKTIQLDLKKRKKGRMVCQV